MDTVLIVDDEKNYPLILEAVLEEEGFNAITANSGEEALEILKEIDVNLVLTDMKMRSMSGIALLETIKKRHTNIPVIIMTAYGTIDKAVEAMRKGADNYILKPFDNNSLIIHINKSLNIYHILQENKRLRSAVKSYYHFGNIIGKSKSMSDVFKIIKKVAPSSANILIEGESGTGKELIAKAIHYNSICRDNSFIVINCASLSESLLESELFGHEKGAFTGAFSTKKGKFEMAHKGTLFLDEIGEISLSLQVKLLRVLQEKIIERVGGTKPISVNFRLICATNKNLSEQILKKQFRSDLYYRLNVVKISLPALRDRVEDISLLINHFIDKYQSERNIDIPISGVSKECMRIFFDYNWPGNIRELENVIERAMILCPNKIISPKDLPKIFKESDKKTFNIEDLSTNNNLYETLNFVEKTMIKKALQLTNNIQAHAAKLLGIGKSGLNQKIKKHNLNKSSK